MAPALPSEAALRAALYAAVHRGTPGDVEFHLAACAGATRVLELGVGAGRISIPLARAGHQVTGIDIDPALLAIARDKASRIAAAARARLDLREGDMRALSLGELRFDRVLIAHSTIYCLDGDDEVRAMLRGVRAHLAPGGRLVIDAYAADAFHHAVDSTIEDPLEEILRVTVAGKRWRVLEQSDWNHHGQRVEVLYRHVPSRGGDAIDTTIVHRYMSAAQLEALLRSEGFGHVRITSSFAGAPFGAEPQHLVVIAGLKARGG